MYYTHTPLLVNYKKKKEALITNKPGCLIIYSVFYQNKIILLLKKKLIINSDQDPYQNFEGVRRGILKLFFYLRNNVINIPNEAELFWNVQKII